MIVHSLCILKDVVYDFILKGMILHLSSIMKHIWKVVNTSCGRYICTYIHTVIVLL